MSVVTTEVAQEQRAPAAATSVASSGPAPMRAPPTAVLAAIGAGAAATIALWWHDTPVIINNRGREHVELPRHDRPRPRQSLRRPALARARDRGLALMPIALPIDCADLDGPGRHGTDRRPHLSRLDGLTVTQHAASATFAT
jgi:hypothetical protein